MLPETDDILQQQQQHHQPQLETILHVEPQQENVKENFFFPAKEIKSKDVLYFFLQ